ncbi:hypothetical protein CHISP_0386 [Chitinispirillum alkaliphilum]|nr:hypothetical protein CHISP_0386 [Chitinispirillum alkaliphilum]
MRNRKKKNRFLFFGFISLLTAGVVSFSVKNSVESRVSTFTMNEWAIGIYTGSSPLNLSDPPQINNPVITAADVTDIKADFVADPFMIQVDSRWYMFFEVLNSLTNQGDIALAKSADGFNWEYDRVVLDEPFHLSYPLVFEYRGEYYMIPESAEASELRLYRALDFPYGWEFERTMIEGEFGDHVLFEHDQSWWIIANSSPYTHDNTRLFFADSLKGEWTEHPMSPIVIDDASRARPGGRVPMLDNSIFWLAQDCKPTYGRKLNAFEIVKLTREVYKERPYDGNPVLRPGQESWRRRGMHHIDAHLIGDDEWIACVDGYRRNLFIRFEY